MRRCHLVFCCCCCSFVAVGNSASVNSSRVAVSYISSSSFRPIDVNSMECVDNDKVVVYSEMALKRKKCSARNSLPVLSPFKWQSGACNLVKWPSFSFIQARRLEMKYSCQTLLCSGESTWIQWRDEAHNSLYMVACWLFVVHKSVPSTASSPDRAKDGDL